MTNPRLLATFRLLLLLTIPIACLPAYADISPFDLKIIQPAGGLDSDNRYYRAYPGIEYNVQITAVGGALPYSFRMVSGPDNMTITSSGVIRWTPYNEQTHPITVSVQDSEGQSTQISWSVEVTREGFLFVDSENGSSDAAGTIADPLKSVSDIYGGTHYEAKRSGKYQDHFVYFREGSYKLDGYRVDARVQWTNSQPVVLMAYPGEHPVLDLSQTYLWADSRISNFYLEGFTIPEMATHVSNPDSHKGFRITGSSSNVTIRNNRFHNLAISEDTHNNQSVIMATASSTRGENWAITGNEFKNIHRAYGIVGYSTKFVSVDNNTFDNLTHYKHAIGPKKSTEHWYIRNNRLTNIDGDAIWLYWAQESGSPFGNMEVSYNYVEARRPLQVNLKQESMRLPVHVFRNTFVGPVEFRAIDSSSTNHYVHRNIIVNDVNGSRDLSAGIDCSVNCSSPSKILLDEDNRVYSSGDQYSVLDESGRLVPSLRSPDSGLLGEYGWETVSDLESPDPQLPTDPDNTDPGNTDQCERSYVPVFLN